MQSDIKARPGILPTLLIFGAVLIAFAAAVTWYRARAPQPVMEPTVASSSVLVPAEKEEPGTVAGAAVNAVASAASTIDAVKDTFTSLRSALDQVTGRVDAIEGVDRAQDEQIATLRTDVDRLATSVTAVEAAASSAALKQTPIQAVAPAKPREPAERASPRPARPKQVVDASVLAVDLWDGKPSVGVTRPAAAGALAEIRFLSVGESQGRVNLKHADVASQRATFSLPDGDVTLGSTEN